jgi:hypothetical protein
LAEHGINAEAVSGKRLQVNRDNLVTALVETLVQKPVDETQQLLDNGYDLDYFVYEVCGLENSVRTRQPDPKRPGIPSPYEGLKAIVKSLLNPKYNGNVQRKLNDTGLWLISFTGFYGVSNDPQVLFDTAVIPSLKSQIATIVRQTTHSLTLAQRVPGVAALELAAFKQEMRAVEAAFQHRYDLAVKELNADQKKALDAVLDSNPVEVDEEIAAIENTAPYSA